MTLPAVAAAAAAGTCRVSLDVERTATSEALEQRIIRERGRLSVLYGALLNSEPVANGWEQLLTAVRKHTLIPADLREMMILRVSYLLACPMEIRAHEQLARQEGVSETKLAAIKQPLIDESPFERDELLLLEIANRITSAQDAEQPIRTLAATKGSRVAVEAIVTAAAYNMVARTVEALGIT